MAENVEEPDKEIKEEGEEVLAPIKAEAPKKKIKIDYLKISLLAVGLVIGIVIGFAISHFSGVTGLAGAEGSTEMVKANIISYIDNLRGAGSTEVMSISTEEGLYKVKLKIGGQELDAFTTLSGKFLFPQALDLTQKVEAPKPIEIPKTDKPDVQLFVMSQCPYGVQAEEALKSVIELVGSKISFALNYIATDKGDGTFDSLHGAAEVAEDTRQLCIAKYFNSKLWDYLSCVSKDYRNVATIWESCANQNELNLDKIKTCSTGQEGKDLLAENVKIAEEKQVGGSPTLLINGALYQGGRTAEAFKQAICSAFNVAPDVCSQVLSSNATPASGSC